jgi:hypothetical protein
LVAGLQPWQKPERTSPSAPGADSYWTEYRFPESAKLLLDAGASVKGIPYPCGHDAVDQLLRAHGAAASP